MQSFPSKNFIQANFFGKGDITQRPGAWMGLSDLSSFANGSAQFN
jgi:hypothetical protein